MKEDQKKLKLFGLKDFMNLDRIIISSHEIIEDSTKILHEKEHCSKRYNEDYQIEIDFNKESSSIEQKRTIIEMTNRLGLNHKVGLITIKMEKCNPIDEKIIRMINKRYLNVWGLWIEDSNNFIDYSIY